MSNNFDKAKANVPPQKPSIGRIVHYTLGTVDSPKGCGRVRPAIITSVSGNNVDEASMQVFTEGGRDDLALVHMKFDVQRSDEPKPGFWHWPPFVKPAAEHPNKKEIEDIKESLSKLDFPKLPPEGKMHLPSPSYVALGTAETWDGKKDSAENPFTLRTEAEVAAAPPAFPPPTPTQREGFTMEIPPPTPTKPSVEAAPDGLPFSTEPEDPKP